jgi:hypothetical protein
MLLLWNLSNARKYTSVWSPDQKPNKPQNKPRSIGSSRPLVASLTVKSSGNAASVAITWHLLRYFHTRPLYQTSAYIGHRLVLLLELLLSFIDLCSHRPQRFHAAFRPTYFESLTDKRTRLRCVLILEINERIMAAWSHPCPTLLVHFNLYRLISFHILLNLLNEGLGHLAFSFVCKDNILSRNWCKPLNYIWIWKWSLITLFAHFVTILNPISLFIWPVHFSVELKACNQQRSRKIHFL